MLSVLLFYVIKPSYGALSRLCFVFVAFPGFLHI